MSMMISGRAMLRAPLTAGEGEGEDGGGSEGGGESKLGGQTRQLLLSSAETACDSFCEQVQWSIHTVHGRFSPRAVVIAERVSCKFYES